MLDLIGPLVFGFVGSAHCLGMCGPLVLAYSLHIRSGDLAPASVGLWHGSALHHLAFHAGRLFTYSLLGAIGSGITHAAGLHAFFTGFRSIVALSGGVLMILSGLVLLGVVSFPSLSLLRWRPSSSAGRFLSRLFSSQTLLSKLVLGFFSGFLPCMLSFAMIVKASATGSLSDGFLTMLSFGLGTVPALFFTGLSVSVFSFRARLLGERLAGAAVLLMGLILIFKGGSNLT